MKSKLMLLAMALTAMTVAGSAFGATCTGFTFTVGAASQPVSSCTIDGGAVSFDSFSVNGLPNGTLVNVTFLDGGAIGHLSGVSFAPSNAIAGQTAYTVSYTASITGGTFTSVSDSATPGGVSTYSYTGTGFNCPAPVATCDQTGLSSTTLTNSANFTGVIPPSQTITLDFNTVANSAVPEPASLIFFGIGFVALGLALRVRRKRVAMP